MNQGLISSRYAKALLSFADSTGEADRVCEEAHAIEGAIVDAPGMAQMLTDPSGITREQKMDMFRAAVAPRALSSTMEKFLELVMSNRREGDLRFILHTFAVMYYRERGVKFATLTTAMSPPPRLAERLRVALEKKFQCKVVLDEKVDPSIIGGMVVRIDDILLDASVSAQLDTLRKEFSRKNKRIV